MEAGIINSIIRFILLLLLQVFLFKQITFGFGGVEYFVVFIYPIFIFLLPLRLPGPLIILASFLLGLLIDLFYDTLGLHAAAATFTAFIRPFVVKQIAPREGYSPKARPTKQELGDQWFFRYAAILMAGHLLFFYSMQAFTPVYLGAILLKTIASWVISMAFILVGIYALNPKA